MAEVRVGTSGWSYDDWDGRFYPEGLARTRWSEHYREVFPTVEINYSFYRMPRDTTVEKWHDEAPPNFRYAVKGSRYITHNLKLSDPDEAVRNIVTRMTPLKTYLGVWLWQLPPNLHEDHERLDRFLDALPGGQRHAVEFRHASWWEERTYEVLEHHGAACVWLSDSEMPDERPVTADFIYVRFHGLGEDRYRYDYSRSELEPWAQRLAEQSASGRDGFVYFNNDHEAKAPHNALTLIEMLGEHALEW